MDGRNLSILDGWWIEGHREGNGWAFGDGEQPERGANLTQTFSNQSQRQVQSGP
jgi:glucan phosphorylase